MAVSLGNNFGGRVVMRADTAAGPVRWANTWEFDSSGLTGGLLVDAPSVATAMVTFHQTMLLSNFYVESVTVSTAAEDGQPYNPDTFYSLTAMVRGTLGTLGGEVDVLPLVNCLHLKKAVNGGREGNLLLRGFLTEADIQSDPLTGAITLVAASGIPAHADAAWTEFLGLCESAGAKPALFKSVAGNVSQVRLVEGLLVKGVTAKKVNNKYFDKGGSTLGGVFEGLVQQYGPTVIGQTLQYLIGTGGTPPLLP